MPLLLNSTQNEIQQPYTFKSTNIRVFSLEEALYHVYHYWKQSIDDFLSPEFVFWLQDEVQLPLIASKVRELEKIDSFSGRMIAFLQVIDYFDYDEIKVLEKELQAWEKRLEWEKLKDRADLFMRHGEPQKALYLYKQALSFGNHPVLEHNLGICLMAQKNYDEASFYLENAYEKSVGFPNHDQYLYDLIESLVRSRNLDKGEYYLFKAEEEGETEQTLYLRGEIMIEKGHPRNAFLLFEKAWEQSGDTFYLYRMVDMRIKMRQYELALSLLEKVEKGEKNYFLKQAEIHYLNNNLPIALRCLNKALMLFPDDVDLWVALAQYHRLDYDLDKALSAIVTALGIEKNNPKALLEFALIKKLQGKTKEYQNTINEILCRMKQNYRNTVTLSD